MVWKQVQSTSELSVGAIARFAYPGDNVPGLPSNILGWYNNEVKNNDLVKIINIHSDTTVDVLIVETNKRCYGLYVQRLEIPDSESEAPSPRGRPKLYYILSKK